MKSFLIDMELHEAKDALNSNFMLRLKVNAMLRARLNENSKYDIDVKAVTCNFVSYFRSTHNQPNRQNDSRVILLLTVYFRVAHSKIQETKQRCMHDPINDQLLQINPSQCSTGHSSTQKWLQDCFEAYLRVGLWFFESEYTWVHTRPESKERAFKEEKPKNPWGPC